MNSLDFVNEYIKDIKKSKIERNDGESRYKFQQPPPLFLQVRV